jgi:hypothetical protein
MATLSFKLDQLFILLVPELDVVVNFPNEVEFVQKSLSILSKVVLDMNGPLPSNPLP